VEKNVWKMVWRLLSRREKFASGLMMLIAVLGAGAQVMMIGSVMPFLSIISNPTIIETNTILRSVYEYFGFTEHHSFVVWIGVVTILVIVSANMVMVLRQYAIHRFTFRRVHSISIRLAKSYLSREYVYFLDKSTGDISKRILSEANSISTSFLRPAVDLVSATLSVAAIVLFLMFVNPVVTIAGAALVICVYGLLYFGVAAKLRFLGEERLSANRDRFTTIGEAFGGIKDIKILGKEDLFFRKFEVTSRRVAETDIMKNILSDLPRYGIQAIFFGGVVVLCLFMIDPVSFNQGGSSLKDIVPTLGAFALAGQRLLPEAQKIYASLTKIVSGTASVKSVYEDTLFSSNQDAAPEASDPFQSHISISNVSYRYPGATVDSLSEISFEIQKGRKIGVVGGTGSGKSTLADLCLGLLSPSGGVFQVDNAVIDTRIKRQSWRSRVGYVPQEIFLIDGSFTDNIAFGVDPKLVDMQRVIECAKNARLHDVVMNHSEEGYDSKVGERGIRLSGGQRQRIGIARALYRGADFLVMDEATSALDNETEREVIAAIDNLPAHLTVMMIAHRLTTLRGCDEIITMEEGSIVERGSWDDLMDQKGIFARMVNSTV